MTNEKILGWRGLSLLIPAIASSIGFFAFAVLGYSFTELNGLPQAFRTTLVLVGSFSLAFGSEVGTLSNVIEIYRKGERKQTWDWIALGISVTSTVAAFLLAFSALLGANTTWSESMKLYGPVGLGLLAALDSYGGFLEFGLYLHECDQRHKPQRVKVIKSQEETVNPTGLESLTPDPEKRERLHRLLTLYQDNPKTPKTHVADALGVSPTTVYGYLNDLEAAQVIKRNGNGVTVIA